MNQSHNPFAEPVAVSRGSNAGRWLIVLLVIGMIAGGFLAGLAFWRQAQTLESVRGELKEALAATTQSQSEGAELKEKLLSHQARLSELSQKLTSSQSSIADLEGKLASNQARIAGLESENEAANQNRKGLEEQMRAELQSKDVTISRLQGKLTVNILDRILFDSGEAVLKPGGESVLRKIAAILEQHPTLKIHVVGHTDNVPIRPNSRSRFASNWELSTARALAAVRFLTESAGVDPQRVGAVGYGEFRPLADNTTAEGRARNRRIAITILADELVGADTVPTANPVPPSAAPATGLDSDTANPAQP